MYECQVCLKEYKSLGVHLHTTHGMNSLDYAKFYYEIDIVFLYEQGKSTLQIAALIGEMKIGIAPLKKEVSRYLKSKGVILRDIRSRAINYFKQNDVWNKGETKESHPSVKKYADSRTGENNPFFKIPPEERGQWRKKKTKEELEIMAAKTGETLRRLYREGAIIPRTKKNSPEMFEKRQILSEIGYRKWIESGARKIMPESKPEKMIGEFLEENKIQYQKQFTVNCLTEVGVCGKTRWFFLDYYLPELKIALEFNGTYWHCDPRHYKADFYNTQKKQTAQQIWEKDELKVRTSVEKGIRVLTIWEMDTKNLTREEFKAYVLEAIEDFVNRADPKG